MILIIYSPRRLIHKLTIGYTAQPEKRDTFVKNDNEGRDVLDDSRKRYRCPWAEIGKYGPRREPIRLHYSLSCPLRKK